MNNIFKAALVAGIIILSGCSSYQLSGERERVIVDTISPRNFTVNFCGNAYMTQKEAEKYAFQRAAQAALSKGYTHFVVLKRDDNSKLCYLNSMNKYSQTMPLGTRDSASYDFPPFETPNVTLTIQCFSKSEKIPDDAIDAQAYLQKNFPGLIK